MYIYLCMHVYMFVYIHICGCMVLGVFRISQRLYRPFKIFFGGEVESGLETSVGNGS